MPGGGGGGGGGGLDGCCFGSVVDAGAGPAAPLRTDASRSFTLSLSDVAGMAGDAAAAIDAAAADADADEEPVIAEVVDVRASETTADDEPCWPRGLAPLSLLILSGIGSLEFAPSAMSF